MLNKDFNLSLFHISISKNDTLVTIDSLLTSNNNKVSYACAVNLNILVESYRDQNYFQILKKSRLNFCDSINAKRILNICVNKQIELYPGPNLFSEYVVKSEVTQFFLGGSEEVINGLKKNIKQRNKFITNDMFYSPPYVNVDDFEYQKIAKLINNKSPQIIWIGLGAPKQEIFMSKILPYLDSGLMIGVGAAFNFYSGIKKYRRAPKIFQSLKLEWLYRLTQEPVRIFKRQFINFFYIPIIVLNNFYGK